MLSLGVVVERRLTAEMFALQANERSRPRKEIHSVSAALVVPPAQLPGPALMNSSRFILCRFRSTGTVRNIARDSRDNLISRWQSSRHISQSRPRCEKQAGDDPNFMSIVDNPPNLVRTGRKHGPGLIILGL